MQFLQPIRSLNYIAGSIWRDPSNHDQRFRRLWIAVGWQAWKRLIKRPKVVPLFNGFRFVAYPDCGVSSSVFYSRIPNFRALSFLREHVRNGTLVDVGANVGLVSLCLADKIQHALLFEPNPLAAARARENLVMNKLNFEVHELALSDQAGNIAFENAGGVDTCNRTVVGFATDIPTITVPRMTFDQFFAESCGAVPSVTAVKIDVEGHENSVLRGMLHFLQKQRPRLVMFEYLRRTNLEETIGIFAQAGYRIIEITAQGPAWATAGVAPLQDLFACPEELSAEFVPETATKHISSV